MFWAEDSVRGAGAFAVFEDFAVWAVKDANAFFAGARVAVCGCAAAVFWNAGAVAGFVAGFADAIALVAFFVIAAGDVCAKVDGFRNGFRVLDLVVARWRGL